MEQKYLLLLGIIFVLLFFTTVALRRKASYPSGNVKKAMVIVEPRKHQDFERVLQQFDEQMPTDWDLYVFHGKSARRFLEEVTTGLSNERKVYLKALPSDNLTINEYNRLLKDPKFWDQIDAEDILIFQTDTALCAASPFSIDRFRQYGYIGCSNKKDSIGMTNQVWAKDIPFYGIGGLSFRKKSFTMKCIKENPNVHPDRAEDVFYSECIHKETGPIKPESAKILCEFCAQHSFNAHSFGAHKTKTMDPNDKKSFYAFCPEAKFLDTQT